MMHDPIERGHLPHILDLIKTNNNIMHMEVKVILIDDIEYHAATVHPADFVTCTHTHTHTHTHIAMTLLC